jgi:hypothetical protein
VLLQGEALLLVEDGGKPTQRASGVAFRLAENEYVVGVSDEVETVNGHAVIDRNKRRLGYKVDRVGSDGHAAGDAPGGGFQERNYPFCRLVG